MPLARVRSDRAAIYCTASDSGSTRSGHQVRIRRRSHQRLPQIHHEPRQARESARASSIARARYREGVADFLALLDTERTQLQAEDGVAQAESQVFTSVVAVYKALGGG